MTHEQRAQFMRDLPSIAHDSEPWMRGAKLVSVTPERIVIRSRYAACKWHDGVTPCMTIFFGHRVKALARHVAPDLKWPDDLTVEFVT